MTCGLKEAHDELLSELQELQEENARLRSCLSEDEENRLQGGGCMSVITNERTKAAIDDWMAVKDGRESRWHKLFGTPEKAVETLAAIETCCNIDWDCDKCPLNEVMPSCVFCGADDRFKLATLEWLRGDSE